MTILSARPVDPDQLSILDLVTDVETPLGKLHADDFRAACLEVGRANGGWVHPSKVSRLLHTRFGEINPRWFSGMWGSSCGRNGFMDKTDVPEPIDPEFSRGNGNKDVFLRMLRVTP